jgi:hypothetical protein
MFPRWMPKKEKYKSLEPITVDGHEGLLGITPVFKYKGIAYRKLEVFFYVEGKRYLMIGFAPETVFLALEPVFRKMIMTFKLDLSVMRVARPSHLKSQTQKLIKLAEEKVLKKNIQSENLYLAWQDYRRAFLIFNHFDYQRDNTKRKLALKQFKQVDQLLKNAHRDLKFKMEQGFKLKDTEAVFEAASEIIHLIPDSEDRRFKNADYYYQKYKHKFIKNY